MASSKSPSKSPPRRGRSAAKQGQSRSRSPTRPPPSRNSGSKSRSASPPLSSSTVPSTDTNAQIEKAFLKMLKLNMDDDEDYKSIKLPVFSDGTEWEAVVFELKINLEKVWKYSNHMDIVDYLDGVQQFCKNEYEIKADKIIYHAIVTAAKRDSFARKMIMAAEHDDAVPQVKRNQGLKLFNLFQSTFLNKSKDQANLPNAQKEFFLTKQKKGESAKDYISRVDKSVSDLAVLNEKFQLTLGYLF